jgi:hypothetical protein
MQVFWVSYVLGLDFCVVAVSQSFLWMWCTIQDISMLYVVSVVTMMVITIYTGTHENHITIDVEVTTNVKVAHHVIFYNFAKH